MTPSHPSLARGYLIAVIGTALWSTTAIFIGYLSTNYKMPPLVLAFWRDLFVAAGLWLGLGLLSPKLLALPNPKHNIVFFIVYGLVLAVFNALWTTSVTINGAAVATVLAYSSPAFTAVVGWRLFGERLDAAKITAVFLSLAGCALVSGAYSQQAWQVNPLGIGVGLLSGALFAAYSIFGKASARRGVEAWTAMAYTFSFGALFLLLLQRPATILWLGSSVPAWSVLILLSIGPTIGGYGLYTVSLMHLPASVASLITTLEPPMTAILAFALLNETLTGIQLFGGALILTGVLLLRISEKARESPRPQRYYPGTGENPFHFALVAIEQLERIPLWLMPFLLALIAAATSWLLHSAFALTIFIPLTLFSLGDLVLLAALPRAGRSFGPVQPPVLLMSLLRALAALSLSALTILGMPPQWAAALNIAVQAAGTLLAIEAYWFGPYRLGITRMALRSPKLNPAAPPLRLLHLSDLHIEQLTRREHDLLQQISMLKPDAILFSGDLLNLSYVDDARARAECRTFLSGLHAPLGVYAVTGSLPVDTPQAVRAVLDGLPVRRLDNERITLAQDGQSLDLIGLTCTHHPDWDGASLQALTDGQHDRFSLLLYHTPDLAPAAAQLGIDLQLSGHTHGGQVRLPLVGALITSSLHGKRFEMGKYTVDTMLLYVSRGIGMEGKGAPRVRFLCPPEAVLWEIGGG